MSTQSNDLTPLVPEFVRESNAIEGIVREPSEHEVFAHLQLFDVEELEVRDVAQFVRIICGAELRDRVGMDVRVGTHRPPPGGPEIRHWLQKHLGRHYRFGLYSPHVAHLEYEDLHPFMDGNGRSGRALWAYSMLRLGRNPFEIPFLRAFYYETLSRNRGQFGHSVSRGRK